MRMRRGCTDGDQARRHQIRFNGAASMRMRRALTDDDLRHLLVVASMGPHPCGCGGEASHLRPCRGQQRFNGAASMRMRRGYAAVPVVWIPSCFNGAASMRMRRACVFQKRKRKAHQLQWGRIHADAEGSAISFPSSHWTVCFNGAASMRMRRELCNAQGARESCSRFNGAASMRMRRARLRVNLIAVFTAWLQWGRIHADAEGHDPYPKVYLDSWLQWGRIHADAEGRGPR